MWPVPDNNTYTLVYYRIRRIEDSAAGANNRYDADRFLPAIISDLTYQLALKNPSVTDRITLLKQVYEDFNLAATEDRDRSDFRIVQPYRRELCRE